MRKNSILCGNYVMNITYYQISNQIIALEQVSRHVQKCCISSHRPACQKCTEIGRFFCTEISRFLYRNRSFFCTEIGRFFVPKQVIFLYRNRSFFVPKQVVFCTEIGRFFCTEIGCFLYRNRLFFVTQRKRYTNSEITRFYVVD